MIIETDMQTPRDFDALHLLVQQETSPGQFHSLEDQSYEIPAEATLPTTYAIAAGSSADQNAFIRVTALRQGVTVVLREAELQVPQDRVAELRLVLSSKCSGPRFVKMDSNGNPVSACPDPAQACNPESGTCTSPAVATSSLPVYSPGDGADAGVPTSLASTSPTDAGGADAPGAAPDAGRPESQDAESPTDGNSSTTTAEGGGLVPDASPAPGTDAGDASLAPGTDGGAALAAARAQCVQILNQDRATLSPASPPLAEDTANEACVDGQAQADFTANMAYSAFGKCRESAANECPSWPGPPSAIMTTCLAQMWAEGPPPSGQVNHWSNMSNAKYTKVACGFYQTPTGSWWATQDFSN